MKRFAVVFCFVTLILGTVASEAVTEENVKSKVDSYVEKMTVRQKTGQLCLMNFRFWEKESSGKFRNDSVNSKPDYKPLSHVNGTVRTIITDYYIGNVILFSENLAKKESGKKFISDLNTAALENGIPLLFGIDQEGGNVNRIYTGAVMPSAMAVGTTGNPRNAFIAGQCTGRLMNEYGIHCDFAPVCDVASNEKNPVIGIRSYSGKPALAAGFSTAMKAGLESCGIIPAAKHFPGHGDTDTDSHLALPVICKKYSKWNKCERIPFQKNIDEGIPIIMTAHIQFPELDDSKIKCSLSGTEIIKPATLSEKILTGLLRNQMGFNGVIVSDAMDMNAITENLSPPDAFIQAVKAGCDMICHPVNVYSESSMKNIEELFSGVESAVQDGTLPLSRLNEAASRIILLKIKAGLLAFDGHGNLVPQPECHNAGNDEETEKARKEAYRIQREAINKSFTVKSKKSLKEFRSAGKILVIGPYAEKINAVTECLKEQLPGTATDTFCYQAINAGGIPETLAGRIADADSIILVTKLTGYGVKDPQHNCAAIPKEIAQEIRLQKKQKQTFVISTQLPYDRNTFKGFNYCATFNYRDDAIRNAVNLIIERSSQQ